jgi:hypothetical protein
MKLVVHVYRKVVLRYNSMNTKHLNYSHSIVLNLLVFLSLQHNFLHIFARRSGQNVGENKAGFGLKSYLPEKYRNIIQRETHKEYCWCIQKCALYIVLISALSYVLPLKYGLYI